MKKSTTFVFIALLALTIFVSACSSKTPLVQQAPADNVANQPNVNAPVNAPQDSGADLTADATISAPTDIGTLDDIDVSDEVPQ